MKHNRVCFGLRRLLRDARGATAIEYGLIAAGIALGISIVVFTVGDQLEPLFVELTAALGMR